MRRWIIFVLALQFFCSASTFALGQDRLSAAFTEADSVVISLMDGNSKAVQDTLLTLLDTEHGLLDDNPELPEYLDLTWNCLSLADPWDVPRALAYPDWAPPTLAGLQRPPQA
ncbi:MAG: hypothetical protein Q8K21_14750 [Hydrogenophaga sp.]|uniref:hypothetical protein n=1 Tax=Hydrogenophaga sp. TaxID=1904254 RepID=UPI002731BB31|nr:hypothetical protein [Hydrogenophaga sp.]MDP2165444.1 hypothetical protein [Hydrogenophaga sp.]MDP3475436.1 hypothetical protein [Hydrogenophaga sp.]